MKTRAVISSAMWVLAALTAGCGKQQSTASAETAAAAPGVGYEAHVNAGGVAPPAQSPPIPMG